MKTFSIGFSEDDEILVLGDSAVEVAQMFFYYNIEKRIESFYGFDDEFRVLVEFNNKLEKLTVFADKAVFLSELDDIIWEAIAEEFVVEVK